MRRAKRLCTIANCITLLWCTQSLHAQCLTGSVIAFDAAAGDQFGYNVAMSGKRCIVGARLEDAGAVNSGSAYIYKFDIFTGQWVFESKLAANDGQAGDEFGYAVAIDCSPVTGDVAIVGARHDDDEGIDSGSAYIFKRSGSNWIQTAKLTASDGAAGDRFGFAVAIVENHALISARDDDAPTTNTGSVYSFFNNGSTWVQQTKLVPSDVVTNDQFGHALAMAKDFDGGGAVAIIGSWRDDAPTTNCGSAYTYRLDGQSNSWTQSGKLTAADAAANDEFGFSVGVCSTAAGEKAIIGARNNDDAGSNSGSAYVFTGTGSNWTQQYKLQAGDAAAGDQFGQSVAISPTGSVVVVGANANDQNGSDAGAAYLFTQPILNAPWEQGEKFIATEGAPGDLFGTSVAATANQAVVSCHLNDAVGADSGTVYFYAGLAGGDLNGDGVPDGCDLLGDLNGDGQVDTTDVTIVITGWGLCPAQPAPCQADADGSGFVSVDDLLIVILNWT